MSRMNADVALLYALHTMENMLKYHILCHAYVCHAWHQIKKKIMSRMVYVAFGPGPYAT